jgi:phenylacetate-CoA ligase
MTRPLGVASHLARMKLDQWKTPDELRELQEKKLARLLSYAKRSVPFYKSIPDERSLASIPATKKEDIARDPDSFIRRGEDKRSLFRVPTSGSTGIPLEVFYDVPERDYYVALRYHAYTAAGLSPFDLQAHVTYRTYGKHPVEGLGLFRSRYLDFRRPESELLEELKAMAPGAVFTYPSLILPLALKNAESEKPLHVKRVFSSAEVLGRRVRELAERSFGCKVFDRYGAVETASIAFECPQGGMHVYSDSIIVEILDKHMEPVPEGRTGDVYLTPLWRHSMPFIRYKIGDRAAFGRRCRCGRGLATLGKIEGREDDFIVLPSGRRFISVIIGASIRHVEGIAAFMIVQERSGALVVKAKPAGKGAPPDARAIRDAVLGSLPEPVTVEVEFVDSIPRSRNGKLRDFESKIGRHL